MRRWYFILSIISCLNGFAQKVATRIDFEIKGLEDKKIFLGVEHYDRQIILDTIRLNSQGEGTFESKARLSPGVYVVSLPNQKYFELLIDDEQYFYVYTDTSDIFMNLNVVGASQTALFVKYQKLLKLRDNQKVSRNQTLYQVYTKQIDRLTDSIQQHMQGTLLWAYVKLLRLPQQNFVRNEKVSLQSFIQQQNTIEKNFIENFPFDETRLINTRLLYEQLSYFFNVFISQHPDTLISRMDTFLSKARSYELMYKYLLAFFNQNYRHCRTPAYERVYMHLAENYYLNGNAPWADKRFLEQLEKKVSQQRSSTIGKTAFDLQLYSPDDKPLRLFDRNAKNILLFFWDPDCQTCRQAFERLTESVKTYKAGQLIVVAIYVHSNKSPWLEYLKKHKSPFVHAYDPLKKSNFMQLYRFERVPYFYLIDENKKIRSKGSSLESILKNVGN